MVTAKCNSYCSKDDSDKLTFIRKIMIIYFTFLVFFQRPSAPPANEEPTTRPSPLEEPLPAGWAFSKTPDGRVFYIDHNRRITTWVRSWRIPLDRSFSENLWKIPGGSTKESAEIEDAVEWTSFRCNQTTQLERRPHTEPWSTSSKTS